MDRGGTGVICGTVVLNEKLGRFSVHRVCNVVPTSRGLWLCLQVSPHLRRKQWAALQCSGEPSDAGQTPAGVLVSA